MADALETMDAVRLATKEGQAAGQQCQPVLLKATHKQLLGNLPGTVATPKSLDLANNLRSKPTADRQ